MTDIIVLTGPESCGKTTLAKALSETLRVPMVPEVSRVYLGQQISRNSEFRYSEPDLLEIAGQQHSMEQLALANSPDLLVCDTDLLVLLIWSEVRFGHCHPWILDTLVDAFSSGNRHYLLCHHDVPWEEDPLRENADSRAELFELYRQKLDYFSLSHTVMTGDVATRLAAATKIIECKGILH